MLEQEKDGPMPATDKKVGENLDKLFKSEFLTEGRKEGRMSDEKSQLIETTTSAADKSSWENFRVVVKKLVTEYETIPKETNYIRDQRGSERY